MPQSSFTIGRVTADLELQTSANKNNYVRFNLAENIGYGESSHTQFLQVWAWGDDAKYLISGKVKKGSLIWVSGQLMLEEYKKQDGTADKRLKVILDNWGYIPAGKPKGGSGDEASAAETNTPFDTPPDGEIDGDRETLPE
jgi:single-stranded DNA-binding protein